MNKIKSIVLLLVLALVPALSAADKVNLKVSQIDLIAGAIASLDKIEREIPQGNDPVKVVTGVTISGPTRMTLSDDLAALKPIIESYRTTRDALIKDVSEGGDSIKAPADPKDTAAAAKYQAQIARFIKEDGQNYAKPYDVQLTKIHRADLNLEKNPIPFAVIDALGPILKD